MIISELKQTYTYAIRKVIQSQTPETQGPLLAIKQTWDEACEYRDELYKENGTRSYVSVVAN